MQDPVYELGVGPDLLLHLLLGGLDRLIDTPLDRLRSTPITIKATSLSPSISPISLRSALDIPPWSGLLTDRSESDLEPMSLHIPYSFPSSVATVSP